MRKTCIPVLAYLFLQFSLFLYAETVQVQDIYPAEPAKASSLILLARSGGEMPVGDRQEVYAYDNSMAMTSYLELSGTLPVRKPFGIGVTIGYATQGIGPAGNTFVDLKRYWATAGPAYMTAIFPWLTLRVSAEAGYGYSVLSSYESPSATGGSLATVLGAECLWRFGERFGAGIGVFHKYYWDLYQTMVFSLSVEYRFGMGSPSVRKKDRTIPDTPVRPEPLHEDQKKDVRPVSRLSDLNIYGPVCDPVFPVLYKFYEDNPIGAITIKNTGNGTIDDIQVSLFVHGYMDTARQVTEPFSLKKGEIRDVGLKALFNSNMLNITEATRVTAEIGVEYEESDKIRSVVIPHSLRVLDRNALSWEDDRRIAAFITAKDPEVLRLSRIVSGMASGSTSTVVDENLRKAMGMYCALRQLGIKYVVDPRTPYADYSKQTGMVDFLQFPRQTLEYHGGDCDDLCTLYCALLESAGVDTACITVPGHILPAFTLGISPENAKGLFPRSDNLIFHESQVWMPVEVTNPANSFMQAWSEGAKKWRENEALDKAVLYKTGEAWSTYEPVGLPGSSSSVPRADIAALEISFMDEYRRYINSSISADVEILERRIVESNDDPAVRNRLGVLYARHGLLDEAESQFLTVLQKKEHFPTLINIGNIKFLNREFEEAKAYYERALDLQPGRSSILLAWARVNHELENYGMARTAFEKLKHIDGELARKHSYLELSVRDGTRAASGSETYSELIWEE